MGCEAFMPLFDEFVDGELNERDAQLLSTHLAVCNSCAVEVATLMREGEVYASYQRDIEVTPALWHGVHSRIETEKKAEVSSNTPRWKAWFVDALRPGSILRPAFTAVLILIALGVTTIAVMRYLDSRRNSQTVANRDEPSNKIPQSIKNDGLKPTIAAPAEGTLVPTAKSVGPARIPGDMKGLRPTRHNNSENSRVTTSTRDDAGRIAEMAANRNNESRRPFDSPIVEIARHLEQAEMLLRSFRNVRLAEANHAPDISFEKEQSRKLLYRNIVLRREAATQGDISTEKLLATLEPILLDIANMSNRPTDTDVRSIDRRMRNKEIMTALQVHSIVAQNSF